MTNTIENNHLSSETEIILQGKKLKINGYRDVLKHQFLFWSQENLFDCDECSIFVR